MKVPGDVQVSSHRRQSSNSSFPFRGEMAQLPPPLWPKVTFANRSPATRLFTVQGLHFFLLLFLMFKLGVFSVCALTKPCMRRSEGRGGFSPPVCGSWRGYARSPDRGKSLNPLKAVLFHQPLVMPAKTLILKNLLHPSSQQLLPLAGR